MTYLDEIDLETTLQLESKQMECGMEMETIQDSRIGTGQIVEIEQEVGPTTGAEVETVQKVGTE